MTHHIVTITAPAKWIRSNDHSNAWRNRHNLTAAWRGASAWAAKGQHLPTFTGPVHVTATIHRDDKRIFDLDGCAPTVKAAIDGLRDAGCLADDDWRFIPELTIRKGEQWADAALVLRIEPVEVAA